MHLDTCRGMITESHGMNSPLNQECEIIYDTETGLIWRAHRLDTKEYTHFSKFQAKKTIWHKIENKE